MAEAKPVSVTVDAPKAVAGGVRAKHMQKKTTPFRGYLLTAGLDIGTSSSCYAYAFKTNPDNIHVSTFLPGKGHPQSFKAPTSILTGKGPSGAFEEFGFDAERTYKEKITGGKSTDYNLYTDFKMVLYRAEDVSSKHTMVKSLTGTKRPLMDLYVMTLKYLAAHLGNSLESSGASKIHPKEVRWVVCVPATWSDVSKLFLREAAHKAGLIDEVQTSQLVILLEATAAALYCQMPEARWSAQHLEQAQVPVGTKYLVVDAGAGTVDYTAQQVLEHRRVREITLASGGDWGGRHVDRRFADLMKRALGDAFIADFSIQYPLIWYDLQLDFEKAKASADPDKNSISLSLPIAMERHLFKTKKETLTDVINKHSQAHGFTESDGALVISHKAVDEMFDPSIDKIVTETKRLVQLKELKGLNFVYLVGGFASSKMLQSKMKGKKVLGGARLAVPPEARTAVVKGAVIYGHNPSVITRIAKKTYGVSTFSDFHPDKHTSDRKADFGKSTLCKGLLLPFVQKGEELKPGTHGHMVVNPVVPNATYIEVDFFCLDRTTKPDEVIYVDDKGVQRHASIRVSSPNTAGGVEREVMLHFTFDDEISIIAEDIASDTAKPAKITFDYDIRK